MHLKLESGAGCGLGCKAGGKERGRNTSRDGVWAEAAWSVHRGRRYSLRCSFRGAGSTRGVLPREEKVYESQGLVRIKSTEDLLYMMPVRHRAWIGSRGSLEALNLQAQIPYKGKVGPPELDIGAISIKETGEGVCLQSTKRGIERERSGLANSALKTSDCSENQQSIINFKGNQQIKSLLLRRKRKEFFPQKFIREL
ncbi:hypothetical protein NDU88_003677 [Pleurodeles waltl]|uniref:Uncharacterized protein n=1 Tax=Pleurodeles waltl TaxID=8319 RepID=A0AAV7T6W4_PLEWA|nr:hypothetical protein NDU88_003677 [Pleurodeles waltl]